jgi:hypothetical protein
MLYSLLCVIFSHFEATLTTRRAYSTLSFFVAHSLSFSLAGPDTAQSGVSIEFIWTLDDGEPLSFGLMQRSLAGDAPIVGIDAVTNSAGARTGTALVIFRTTGYAGRWDKDKSH